MEEQLFNENEDSSFIWVDSWTSPREVANTTKALMSETISSFSSSVSRADSGHDTILIDSCATLHITSNENELFDFVEAGSNIQLKGIAKGLRVLGFGSMRVKYQDRSGEVRFLTLRHVGLVSISYAYPALRLLSPQTLCRDEKNASQLLSFSTHASHAELKFSNHEVKIPYSQSNNLPCFYVRIQREERALAFPAAQSMNLNLTTAQNSLLLYHMRLGHVDMRVIQDLSRLGLAPRNLASCMIPRCSDCIFGKQVRKPTGSSCTISGKLDPGDAVHCDQLISGHPGIYINLTKDERVTVVNVFVDAASRLPKAFFTHTTTAEQAVLSKISFERFAGEHNVKVRHYHADNGVYKSQLWMKHCAAKGQSMSFCGVSAHHQNPIAERLNRRATEMARTLLITVQLHWEGVEDLRDLKLEDYWPFAMEYAFVLLAKLPIRSQQYSPQDVFTRIKDDAGLARFHTWGCPVYVLDPRLASGKKIPRWKPRSQKGLYLGFSRVHSTNVRLVLNLTQVESLLSSILYSTMVFLQFKQILLLSRKNGRNSTKIIGNFMQIQTNRNL